MLFKCPLGIEIAIGIGIERGGIMDLFDFDSDPDDFYQPSISLS